MNHIAWTKRKAIMALALCVIIAVSSVMFLQNNQTTQAAVINPHPGLVGWWRFDEGIGITAGDSSGNGNNGTIFGATSATGKYGQALSFNGVNNYVEIPNNSVYNSQSISVSAWFERSGGLGTNWMPLLGKWGNNWMFYFKPDNRLDFYIKNSDGSEHFAVSTTIFSDLNTWHQVVGTYDGNNIKIYVDGQLQGITPNVGGILTGSDPVRVGRDQVADYFDGIIDEVNIYNRALSPAEVQSEFQQSPDSSPYILANVPQGTTQVITTLSWQGTGNITVTITTPSQTYTESMMSIYQKTTYSTSGGGLLSMLNIKRTSIPLSPAIPSAQSWNITLSVDNTVSAYQISVETQD